MSKKQPGLFMPEIDWSDPKFAPWELSNLEMNDEQLEALLEPDEIDFPELTEEQQIELCLKVPCRVELFHGNVCYGVEKGWPKRMFRKTNFETLEPKEKRCIYRDMIRKAVFLYGEYVDEKRLARRLHRTKSRTLAPYYELIFRKNQFMRLKALEQPEPGYDAIISEMVAESDGDDDEFELSQQTVINTGNSGTQKSNETNERSIDLNDNDCIPIAVDDMDADEDDEEQQQNEYDAQQHCNWQSKSTYTITDNFTIGEITELHKILILGSECNVSSCDDDAASAPVSEDLVSSSQDAQSENFNVDYIPEMNIDSFVMSTPLITKRRKSALYDDDDDDEEVVDSLDFLSQGMTARTSTQQQQQHHMQQ